MMHRAPECAKYGVDCLQTDKGSHCKGQTGWKEGFLAIARHWRSPSYANGLCTKQVEADPHGPIVLGIGQPKIAKAIADATNGVVSFKGVSVLPPEKYYGFCQFKNSIYSKHQMDVLTVTADIPAKPVDGKRLKIYGPIGVTLVFKVLMETGVNVAIQDQSLANMDAPSVPDLNPEALKDKKECKDGGMGGRVAAFAKLRIQLGAELGLGAKFNFVGIKLTGTITILQGNAIGHAELLKNGAGKEFSFGFEAGQGQIDLEVTGMTETLWGPHTIVEWSSPLSSPNFLCHGNTKVGCPAYAPFGKGYVEGASTGEGISSDLSQFADVLASAHAGLTCMSAKVCKDTSFCPKKQSCTSLAMVANMTSNVAPTEILTTPNGRACHYFDRRGETYRGERDTAQDGSPCLPWPPKWGSMYFGDGLLKDPTACDSLQLNSQCYSACMQAQPTNNFCRNPTDDQAPFCRTGGSEDEPIFTYCNLQACPAAPSCTYNLPDQSDYTGQQETTVHGGKCDAWSEYPEYAEIAARNDWHNYCRNPRDTAGSSKSAAQQEKERELRALEEAAGKTVEEAPIESSSNSLRQRAWCYVNGKREDCDIGSMCA